MVPAALVILGMISVLPLPLVARLWDDLSESRHACFVPTGHSLCILMPRERRLRSGYQKWGRFL
ncbi:hypothetical protein PF010_g31352 [Phytophthora fragariae]|uniref:Uncharacterized protein n=1 Tax=Phytophthora fragariae TaxID=53985 RepID=A0A6A3ERE6_9STRA|nr:hypothetical protein PF009_g13968 [Phytophthora fragariae]KAE9057499.1 hypothetical protein PF010_g31352 [Phytophthora fragariae]KAE9117505.1 hypothetical protein PF007_g9269 [Phytophthora fragariae]KAE9224835.1 hypothetical protein PF004_g12079 [Phytophthora fragariae]KAE9240660.1 hypothetical protein PF002_g9671 [Phytophthora fragariae]